MVLIVGDAPASHQHPGTDIISPVPIAQIPVAANGIVDTSRVLSAGDGRIAPLYSPEDHGLKAWTCDPYLLAATTGGGSGNPIVSLVEVRDTMSVSAVYWQIATAGASPTSGQSRIGVWRLSDRALVAQTADVSGTIATAGAKATALTSTPTLAPGFYYVGLACVASTRPALSAAPAVASHVGRTAANYRGGQVNTAYTTALPTTLPNIGTVGGGAAWFALG